MNGRSRLLSSGRRAVRPQTSHAAATPRTRIRQKRYPAPHTNKTQVVLPLTFPSSSLIPRPFQHHSLAHPTLITSFLHFLHFPTIYSPSLFTFTPFPSSLSPSPVLLCLLVQHHSDPLQYSQTDRQSNISFKLPELLPTAPRLATSSGASEQVGGGVLLDTQGGKDNRGHRRKRMDSK